MEVIIHTDGGSRGNPGPSAIGILINNKNGSEFYKLGLPIGEATNNIAEYHALLKALETCNANQVKEIEAYLDSELVVKQIQGLYKVKNETLRGYYDRVMGLISKFNKFKICSIPRSENKIADSLVNIALDTKSSIEEGLLFQDELLNRDRFYEYVSNVQDEELDDIKLILKQNGFGFTSLEKTGEFITLHSDTEDAIHMIQSRKAIVQLVKEAGYHGVVLDLGEYEK